MGIILILIGMILLIGFCIYIKDVFWTFISSVVVIFYSLAIFCITFQEVGNSKYFIREYNIISNLIDQGVNDACITESVVKINKAILYERSLLSSKWTNWLGSKNVATLELLQY